VKKPKSDLQIARNERRKLAESDLVEFINLVQPDRVLGNIHREVISWITSPSGKSHKLLLLPRDHQKSSIAGLYAAWRLTQNPAIRILYISSTRNLAIKQLKFIKDIITSDTYTLYWPEMVNKEEARREKWTEGEISVDHPLRKEEYIRDPSIFTAGLTSNIVGMHADLKILDDVVVQNNAYTSEGRQKVLDQYGYLSSVGGAHDEELAVGTRYFPTDLYASFMERQVDFYDEYGNVTTSEPLFEVKEYPVESVGDGTGEFLWPKQRSIKGKWFGFDAEILARKRASYDNRVNFRAQYYNDPQDSDSSPINRDLFQYYDPNYLSHQNYNWFYRRERLNIAAAVDFAYTTGKKSDSTSIVVIGVDGQRNFYILEIDRFKTDKISEYFNRILKLYQKWGFRRIRCEVSVAQEVIVKDLKENYIRKHGLSLIVEDYRPSRWQGSKEERIMSVLEPKYANRQIWHYPSGNVQSLEEELIFQNPAHDDIKDALASAIDFIGDKAPLDQFRMKSVNQPNFTYHSKFGGVN
jgi:phage terminase large subunit-like protein